MRAPAPPPSNSNVFEDKKPRSVEPNTSRKPPQSTAVEQSTSPKHQHEPVFGRLDSEGQSDYVASAIEGLSLMKEVDKTNEGSHSAESGESLEDDRSHLSNSSSKLQGFDTKSMASVTTFAMDEKESIRPDDSASVRAVDDDELSNAPRGSEVSSSLARAGPRAKISGVTIAPRRYHTLTLTNPPRFGDLPVSPIAQEDSPPHRSLVEHESDTPSELQERSQPLPVAPDEKLLDALATPKDRLPLLQLEEKVLNFLSSPQPDSLDLPPQNPYMRLLTHKLADYYMLAHIINDDGISVRIFKTPLITMPTPLHHLAASIPTGPPQAPTAMNIKLLRRAGMDLRQNSTGGSTAASSSAPSKATSDAGQETNSEEGILSSDGTPFKDKSKLTREEREAQYKAARDRIFGPDFQEPAASESASTGENSASMSRSSSSDGKKRTRKVKTPKDDSFEARSAFIPSYSAMHMATMHHYQSQFPEQGYHGSYQSSHSMGQNMNYGSTPNPTFAGQEQSMHYNGFSGYGPSNNAQSFGPMEAWPSSHSNNVGYVPYSQSPNSYQPNVAHMSNQINNPYMQQAQVGMQQNQGWLNNQYQQYSQQPHQQHQPGPPNTSGWSNYQSGSHLPGAQAYGYGNGPSSAYQSGNSYPSQPAVAGTLPRSLFNPQTRSFVPSNANSRTGGRPGRKKPSPPSSQNRVNPSGRAFGVDAVTVGPSQQPPRGFLNNSASPRPKEDSLQQKYGAPSHLPKKPPPSQVSSAFDVDSIINNGATSGSGPLVVNGGSSGST
ncbi:hypothetical protein B0A52_04995 [Exophiala mesophila]|uniref:SUZ domain-containing protein n=1 Tax=Exophiala mesophila TaxID=212818 RepID=A0A438N7A0_EXOME|nr:hypothetical protein B0A52_04995 [Exophiala mesophila]